MSNSLEKIFDYIILKLKNFKRRYCLMNQYCKCCGHEMGYDFNVNDKDWLKLPKKYHDKILCIHCFCKLHPDLENVKFKFFTNWRLD